MNISKLKLKYLISDIINTNNSLYLKAKSFLFKKNPNEFVGYCIYKNNICLYVKDIFINDYLLHNGKKAITLKDIKFLKKYSFKDYKKINNIIFLIKRYIYKDENKIVLLNIYGKKITK